MGSWPQRLDGKIAKHAKITRKQYLERVAVLSVLLRIFISLLSMQRALAKTLPSHLTRRTESIVIQIHERIAYREVYQMSKARIGLIGSGFVSGIHFESLRRVPSAEVVAVASPTESHVRPFAEQRGIPHWFTDYRKLIEMDEIDIIVLVAAAGAVSR